MEGIGRVTARIHEIAAMAERRGIPMGDFSRHLARASSTDAVDAGEVGAIEEPADDADGRIALDAASRFRYTPSTTLGGMVGAPTPVAPATPTGVMSVTGLERYLQDHAIEVRNGRLGAGELVPISGTWHGRGSLLAPAAAAWEQMRAAAGEQGIDLVAMDTYRTWESQDRAHRRHLAGEKTANVLPAGTSEHGNGLAVDITNGSIIGRNDPEWHWLTANARRFGWYPISNETWHWEFRGV